MKSKKKVESEKITIEKKLHKIEQLEEAKLPSQERFYLNVSKALTDLDTDPAKCIKELKAKLEDLYGEIPSSSQTKKF